MNVAPGSPAPLTRAERVDLLRLARTAIGARLGLCSEPVPQLDTAMLRSTGGAFVTLHADGKLRGCVGRATAQEPLHRTVIAMARAAAFEDPRFPPLAAFEWPELLIEISRLTTPERVAPTQVVPGRHGLLVVRGPTRGLLLPQVARRFAWTREEFLRETCCKAGLPPAAWEEQDTEIFVFEAEIFAESADDPPTG